MFPGEEEYFERYYETDEEGEWRDSLESLRIRIESFVDECEDELYDYLKELKENADEVIDETTEEYWDGKTTKTQDKFCMYYDLLEELYKKIKELKDK